MINFASSESWCLKLLKIDQDTVDYTRHLSIEKKKGTGSLNMAENSVFGRSFMGRYGFLAGTLALLTACTQTLDTSSLETEIRDNIIKQGGLSLKAVICPSNLPLSAGESFECVGELESGDLFAIPTRQAEQPGKFEWDVPNTRGLLNLVKLETLFQDTLQTKEGKSFAIDCGSGYKAVKPGESFECQLKSLVAKSAKTATQTARATGKPEPAKAANSQPAKPGTPPETILVTIDPDNNVNWQQVVSVVSDKPVASKATGNQATGSDSESNATSATTAASARTNLSTETQKDLEERFD